MRTRRPRNLPEGAQQVRHEVRSLSQSFSCKPSVPPSNPSRLYLSFSGRESAELHTIQWLQQEHPRICFWNGNGGCTSKTSAFEGGRARLSSGHLAQSWLTLRFILLCISYFSGPRRWSYLSQEFWYDFLAAIYQDREYSRYTQTLLSETRYSMVFIKDYHFPDGRLTSFYLRFPYLPTEITIKPTSPGCCESYMSCSMRTMEGSA